MEGSLAARIWERAPWAAVMPTQRDSFVNQRPKAVAEPAGTKRFVELTPGCAATLITYTDRVRVVERMTDRQTDRQKDTEREEIGERERERERGEREREREEREQD